MVIMAEAAMGYSATDVNASDPFAEGTYLKKFRDNFAYGRTTEEECDWNTHRIPNPENGCPGLSDIFVDHIYFDRYDAWPLTAAISGAHTVGSAKPENSGYDGWWSEADQSGVFNNDYYRSIAGKGWVHERHMFDNTAKNQWKRSDLGRD